MIFLIQTINGKVTHDFSIKLLEAIKYNKWLDSTCDMQYVLSDSCILLPGFCPIGSVEFVQEYLTKVHLKSVKPINIPKSLLLNKYTNRNIFYGTDKDANLTLFTKSTNKIKGITGIYSSSELPYGNYMFSELVDFKSEWRTFIYKNEIVGLSNYLGECTTFPDVDVIKNMIEDYKDAPISYTLDVGIMNSGETSIIECHDFFSCGLYGFNDLKVLPFMFYRWFTEFINKDK